MGVFGNVVWNLAINDMIGEKKLERWNILKESLFHLYFNLGKKTTHNWVFSIMLNGFVLPANVFNETNLSIIFVCEFSLCQTSFLRLYLDLTF